MLHIDSLLDDGVLSTGDIIGNGSGGSTAVGEFIVLIDL